MAEDSRYTLLQRLIHWAVAAIAIFVLAIGLTIGILEFDGVKSTFGTEGTNFLYKYHKTFGVVLLGLMTVRLAVRLKSGRPAYDPPLAPFERVASATVHGLLYLGLLMQPILGWLATAAGGYPVEFFTATLPGLVGKDKALSEQLFALHGTVGWLLFLLITLHVAAALRHGFVRRDEVMKRMSLF